MSPLRALSVEIKGHVDSHVTRDRSDFPASGIMDSSSVKNRANDLN